jgi:hypothetical protein
MIETCFPFFRKDDYDAIKTVFPNHPDFPNAYKEWFYLARKKFLEDRAKGHSAKCPVIDPNQFARFCDAMGVKRDSASLHTFCFEEAARQGDVGTPFLLRSEGGSSDSFP